MKKYTVNVSDHHCTVLEQRRLVSEMTRCDRHETGDTYECYLDATRESRENKACMYS